MTAERDTGAPDAFMVAVNADQLRRVRRRILIALAIEAFAIMATVAVLALTEAHWSWVLFGAATATAGIGFGIFVPDPDAERPRPETELEVAVVVGVEIANWGNASADDQHQTRVIARPVGSDRSGLVHGYHRFRAGDGRTAVPGTLIGIRRFPTMRHLVWLEDRPDPLALARLRGVVGADGEAAGEVQLATVVGVRVTDEYDGDWWRTEVTVRTADGMLLTSDCRRLPEELGPLEPGNTVRTGRRRGRGDRGPARRRAADRPGLHRWRALR